MSERILLLDMANLAFRAFYTTGGLSYDGEATGVLFGIFRDLIFLSKQFRYPQFIFCFDHGPYIRTEIYPEYKQRKEDSEQEKIRKKVRKGLLDARICLKEMGYNNLFESVGYEADDIIARLCEQFEEDEVGGEKVIVSSDEDLYQLLSPDVTIWNPRKKERWTIQTLKSAYGLYPYQWPEVKAIAGCTSDNIQGVPQVGEVRAIQFITKEMPESYVAYQKILESGKIIKRNLRLVTLPLKSTPHFIIKKDELSKRMWNEVIEDFGMKSLVKHYPFDTRKVHG